MIAPEIRSPALVVPPVHDVALLRAPLSAGVEHPFSPRAFGLKSVLVTYGTGG